MSWANYKVSSTTEWDVEEKELVEDGECKCCKDRAIKVVLSDKARNQIKTLVDMHQSLEWFAALIGKEDIDNDTVDIEEIKLFEQEVTGSSVELTDSGNEEMAKIANIGWIHSHNTMDVFFSGTDITTAGMNSISLCVNNKLEFHGKAKRLLPCGDYALLDVEIEYDCVEDGDIKVEAEELISERKFEVVSDHSGIDCDADDICMYCTQKVGKKRVPLKHGVVHQKCYDEYKLELEEDLASEEEGGQYDSWFGFCRSCGYSDNVCECKDRNKEIENLTYDEIYG